MHHLMVTLYYGTAYPRVSSANQIVDRLDKYNYQRTSTATKQHVTCYLMYQFYALRTRQS